MSTDRDAGNLPLRAVLGVAGSLRRASYNRRLLQHAARIAPDRLRIEVADDLIRLPLFDEDLEHAGPPDEVLEMQARVRACDALLLATPEYNFGMPGPVKNFIDWASRPPRGGPLVGKPVGLMGASIGRTGGTVQSQGQLRISLAVIGAHVLPSPPVLVAEAADRFDEHGLTDAASEKVLATALDRFLDFVDILSPDSDR